MRKQLFMIACVVLSTVVLIWHPWHILGFGNKQIASEDFTEAKIIPVTGLTDSAKAMLQKNGFVVVAEENRWQDIPAFYEDCKFKGQPILITTDTMLHVSHLVFDWYLRFLEIAHLRSDILNLTDSGIAMSMAYWEQATNKNIKEAALANASYFYVAKSLLGEAKISEVPDNIRSNITQEFKLIETHKGISNSPLFHYKEDYTQYVPRGHYARSPELAQYFQAMMWYGRMTMRLGGNDISEEEARCQTLQALLICKALIEGKSKGETALDIWKRVEETTAFFAGKADDLTPEEYIPLAQRLFGKNLPLTSLSNSNKLDRFRQEASKLRKPGILSTFWTAENPEDWRPVTQGFRLMGQRFTIDGYVFQQLVFDRVGKWNGGSRKPFTLTNAQGMLVRGFPRGLDLLAVFGSDEAKSIIEEEGDANYQGYTKQLAMLRKKASNMPKPSDPQQSRLALLRYITKTPDARAPAFMKTPAWTRKSLSTALGSWTELKHDTIVYTKQPYSMAQSALSTITKGGPVEKPPSIRGYVEPSPEVYSAIRDAVVQLHANLVHLGFPPDRGLESNLLSLENLLTSLETISLDELQGKPADASTEELIDNFSTRLRSVLRFAHYVDVGHDFQSTMDHVPAVIADVFTDVNSEMVLEEGVGYPLAIYAAVPIAGVPTICKGAVYSYYEFKSPMAQRLTDEKWREILARESPGLPAWTSAYVAGTSYQ